MFTFPALDIFPQQNSIALFCSNLKNEHSLAKWHESLRSRLAAKPLLLLYALTLNAHVEQMIL